MSFNEFSSAKTARAQIVDTLGPLHACVADIFTDDENTEELYKIRLISEYVNVINSSKDLEELIVFSNDAIEEIESLTDMLSTSLELKNKGPNINTLSIGVLQESSDNKRQKGNVLKAKQLLDTLRFQIYEILQSAHIKLSVAQVEIKKEVTISTDELNKAASLNRALLEDMTLNSLATLEKKVNDYLDSIKLSTKEQLKELTDILRELEDEASNRHEIKQRNIEGRISQFNNVVSKAIDKLTDGTQEQQTSLREFSQSLRDEVLKSINNASSSSLEDIQKVQGQVLNSFNEQSQQEVSKINSRIDSEVHEFESKKKEIIEILGDISTAHQSNANRTQADAEKKSADTLRTSGLLALILLIGASLWLFSDYIHIFGAPEGNVTPINQLGFGWYALRFMTITLLTAPAVYMLKESASHRARENLYRQRGTQLSSIGAYLDELPSQERANMKKELAKNFFSFHDSKVDTSNVPDFIKQMKEAIEIAKSITPAPVVPSTENENKKAS